MSNLGIGEINIAKATELFDRFIPDNISDAATSFVESLKINSITEKVRRGRPVIVKRRNVYGEGVADLINLYFRLANTHIRYVSKVREWQRWETKCFQMLNGDRFRATSTDARTIVEDKLPGRSLWDHMNAHTLTQQMLQAAAREYRRAHAMHVDELDGGWSHGDASMPNVIYNEKTGRARLIDFEIMHERSLGEKERHADDLLVFLLDMVDRVPDQRWLPFALTFLRAYDNFDVVRTLRKQLVIPTGLAVIWWNVRTNFAKTAKANKRFKALRRALAALPPYRSLETDRPRNNRRPSINCQAISPGMPTPSSRTLAIKDRAKAVSPGMPRRLPTRT
jgi:hypothetical protein